MSQNISNVASGMRPRPRQCYSSSSLPRNVKKDAGRRILRLPSPEAMTVPIPPSLLQSPHLTSPESVFQKAPSAPSTPSAEDETWLRDTVPLSHSGPLEVETEDPGGSGIEASRTHEGRSPRRIRSSSLSVKLAAAVAPPSSPPLVRTHQKKYSEGLGLSGRWPSTPSGTTGNRRSSEDYFHP
ncbi:hypothetical protein AAF712_001444 [Marasmius tenuissimus]|uniref:Uncharacterized protein n=1 Tax=Marasmius tenuissimus TaxID=585030 RepID=A0ABR3ADY0_9AGAR